ncbi:MAG: protein archease [Nitrospirae bacterium CG_4_10_14_3_um_filter_44_29]|nr:archease [Nitrospirota bacterium]PIP69833.1 MAG: protein archease [Nitrospirae bacterium CG22_combo_CG10-13_8_21_14_all_44_11]PIV66056.1 MAG: protein archease [Nitrospirae bacterium CG01_land_8_20_14_3_00_44_22]PIX89730.1 MAG: protein archease [Nitrospirae bacterium CG_4_10_14_3_um_filter_44_29]
MKIFEVIDISGDVGIRAFGKSIEDVFKNSALGMYSLITDLEGVKAEKDISISVESNSLEGLLVSLLNELIFQFDAYNFIGKRIDIQSLTPNPQSPSLKAIISGEEFDTERHERKLLIKAATYHRLKIEKAGDVWQADIIFDI